MPYHHGDLRRTLLAVAADAIAETGVANLSLRALAKRAGVSNAAPTHHFGDKAGLLTALATEGFDLLAGELATDDGGGGRSQTGDQGDAPSLADMGVAYVRFALQHPSHFAVMFEPSLHHPEDADLLAAQARAEAALAAGVAGAVRADDGEPDDAARIAAWALVHGYATLVLSGAVEVPDPVATAREVTGYLAISRVPRV